MARRPRRNDRLREELAAIDQEVDGAPDATRRLQRVIPIAVAAVALVSFGAITWYAYNQGILEGSEEAAPYVRPKGPLKTAPASPGGLEVPNRDKFVYNQLEQKEEDSKVERLLPPPEQPKEPPKPTPESPKAEVPSTPETTAELPKGVTAAESFKRAAEEAAEGAPPRLPPPGKVEPESKSTEETPLPPQLVEQAEKAEKTGPIRLTPGGQNRNAPPAPPPAAAEQPSKEPPAPAVETARKPPPSAPKPEARPTSGGPGYYVQLGALRSVADAERLWQSAKSSNRTLLGRRSIEIERATVPRKGLFYRVQTGPFGRKADADRLCGALKKRKQGCFVVRRK